MEADVPSDTQLVLLCLDYLLDLRRRHDVSTLKNKKHLDADHISLAVYGLSRSFLRPDFLVKKESRSDLFDCSSSTSSHMFIPNIKDITQEIMTPSEDHPRPYDMSYNDLHPSNLYRFFGKNGLGSGPDENLELEDLVSAGLKATAARCRLEAEKDIVKSPQFERYIQSVTMKGYFHDAANSGRRSHPEEEKERKVRKSQIYKEKYRKAIAKYRKKMVINANMESDANMLLPSPPGSPNFVVPPPPTTKTSNRRATSFHSPPRSCQISATRHDVLSPLTPDTALASYPERPVMTQTEAKASPRNPSRHHHRTKSIISDSSSSETSGMNLSKHADRSYDKRQTVSPSIPRTPKMSPNTPRISNRPSSSSPLVVGKSSSFSTLDKSTATAPTKNERTASPSPSPTPVPKKSLSMSPGASKLRKVVKGNDSPSNSSTRSVTDKIAAYANKTKQKEPNSKHAFSKSMVSTNSMLEPTPSSKNVKNTKTAVPEHSQKAPSKSPLDYVNRDRLRPARKKKNSNNAANNAKDDKQSITKPESMESQNRGDDSNKAENPVSDMLSRVRRKGSLLAGKNKSIKSPTKVADPETKNVRNVRSPSLYEMKLGRSGSSSGVEGNAGSFHEKQSPGSNRRKSDYERKLEESSSKYPNSLSLPDITKSSSSSSSQSGKRFGKANKQEFGAEREIRKSPPQSNQATKGLLDMEMISRSFSPRGCRSPVARMRVEKEEAELNKLRYGKSSTSQHNDEASRSTPVASSHRVRKLASDDGSWIKMTEGKRFAFDTFKSPASKTDLNLDPLKLTPPKCFNRTNLGGSRLFASKVGGFDAATNVAAVAAAANAQVRLGSPRSSSSPRGSLRGSPRGLRESPRNYAPSTLKRAC